MKITLAFDIYNKEKWIESLLDSWISNLSGKNEYEIIIVFDDCKDRSYEIVSNYFKNCPHEHLALFADNKYEIYCNNLALEKATGDYIIFIQDDNWIYDKNWDLLISRIIDRIKNIGVMGFLAGTTLYPPMNYQRIEINRPHKGTHFTRYNIKGHYELGVWQVDAICRPFCISVELLTQKGGLDKEFMPMDGDHLDLSIKLLRDGRKNIYIPFDLVNVGTIKENLSKKVVEKSHTKGINLCQKKHEAYLRVRKNQNIKKIFNLRESKGGLELING